MIGIESRGFPSAESFLAAYTGDDSGCLLVDIRMPGMSGIDLLAELRQAGEVTGGPAPMTARDRSRFLSKMDETLNALLRAHPRPAAPELENKS